MAAIVSAYLDRTGRQARAWLSAPEAGAFQAAEPTMPA
jgi:hypothetical protein